MVELEASEDDPIDLDLSKRLQEEHRSRKDNFLTDNSPMKDIDEFDIERYNQVFHNSSSSKEETMLITNEDLTNKDEDLLHSIPETSNRSYKNESEDEYLTAQRSARNNVKRPDTFQGAPKEEESFNLLKSGESYDNFKQRGTAGFGEEE